MVKNKNERKKVLVSSAEEKKVKSNFTEQACIILELLYEDSGDNAMHRFTMNYKYLYYLRVQCRRDKRGSRVLTAASVNLW